MSRRIQCVYRNNDAIDCEAMRAVEDMNLRVSEDIGRLAAQVLKKMIDKKEKDVFASLPLPEKNNLISKTLVLPSNFKLILPRFAEIKLADGANCLMVRNQMVSDYAERLPGDLNDLCKHFWYYVNEYSPEAVAQNIEISGGIWNFNNMNQLPNPEQTKVLEPYGYTGEGMLFYAVKNLKLSYMTLKDPVHWGVLLDRVSYFTVEDITFDYNYGNPYAINMDGIHCSGNCHFGMIRNLKGACYDDLVALNAHEGSRGPITNIEIDGIFAETCHSAVRLLTVKDDVKNIHISNVYGTYYQYCIGFTKYYPGETTGGYDGISIDHIYASKALRGSFYLWPNAYVYPFIYMQEDIRGKNIKIADMHRQEYNIPVETIYVGKRAVIDNMVIDNVITENHTDHVMPLIVQYGTVNRLVMNNIRTNGDPEIIGDDVK